MRAVTGKTDPLARFQAPVRAWFEASFAGATAAYGQNVRLRFLWMDYFLLDDPAAADASPA